MVAHEQGLHFRDQRGQSRKTATKKQNTKLRVCALTGFCVSVCTCAGLHHVRLRLRAVALSNPSTPAPSSPTPAATIASLLGSASCCTTGPAGHFPQMNSREVGSTFLFRLGRFLLGFGLCIPACRPNYSQAPTDSLNSLVNIPFDKYTSGLGGNTFEYCCSQASPLFASWASVSFHDTTKHEKKIEE